MDGYGRWGHDFKSRASTSSATPALDEQAVHTVPTNT